MFISVVYNIEVEKIKAFLFSPTLGVLLVELLSKKKRVD